MQELVREFSLERVTPSPAIFDMEKLYWLNRHYIKESVPEKIAALARSYFANLVGAEPAMELWLDKIIQMLGPSVDRLEQLPEKAALIFNYDAKAALASPDNAEVLALPNTDAVLARFLVKILENEFAGEGKLTPEEFKKIVNEVKAETGAKGKELFHPIRIVVTGSHSGPEFDKLIPILEEGSHLKLPKHVLSVRERAEEFGRARGK
jgi:glutamyl-tRNA synthetase/nondiscriminating glutamyl-tRNA synthetase